MKYIRTDADRLRLARLAWYFPLDISNASINWSINGEWVSRLGLVISITSISISRFCAANELRTVSVIRLGLTASTLRSMDGTKSTLPQRADRTWRSGFSAFPPKIIYCKDLQASAKKPWGPVVVYGISITTKYARKHVGSRMKKGLSQPNILENSGNYCWWKKSCTTWDA